jgi:hypothetical protein
VRRLQTAAIRSMTDRILVEVPPEGNFRIVSPYVVVSGDAGMAGTRAVVVTRHALPTPARLCRHGPLSRDME